MEKTVTKIKKSMPDKITFTRVAAYARVSSGKDAMLHSLSAQVSHYSNMIQHHKGWLYVGVYADEALTGTKDTREQFQRLLADCRNAKIDLVITKSISRFARNTVTLLETIRELKSLGIDVYFEEQNIHSISNDGELMLTILASYAQEESLSVSENCKWKIRKNFEKGIANTFSLYGYEKVGGEIKIKEDEAEIVREIFGMYLSGMGTTKIAKCLKQQNKPSPKGAAWTSTTVKGTLKNEKYVGDMLLQKYYTKDHLSKKSIRNNGVLPKYYAEETHPPIVSKEDFDEVQRIFSERDIGSGTVRYDYDFKGMVFCGCCGWRYRRKKNYKKYVWKCGAYSINGPEACHSKQIPDNILHELAEEFDKPIEKIIVMPENNVKFIFDDNTEIIKHWIQPSRADSWNDEMKKNARKKLWRGILIMPKVTKIDATINPVTHMPSFANTKRRVAGYARVSTDSDEQFTSYEAQVDYYTNYIKSRSDWQFVEVYTDEGISATNTKHRDGFNKMIDDALSGKIDLIVTKSVSRFARNTVDSLVTVRKLKEKGVEVYFEKENIYTLDSKGELLITIMSSLAQEESRSISENVTWGQRKRFADGKVSMPYKCFLGYKKGEDGTPEIVPEEAKTVRRIYSMYIQGKSIGYIARQLTKEYIPSPSGKGKWASSTIQSILTNEKYKGDALLQKTFTVDFLQKKIKKNEGEIPQYYVEHSHEPIIDPREFELVQQEIARRSAIGKHYSGQSILSARIICGDCRGFYGSKVWHSTSKYKRIIWQCNEKFRGKSCRTPHYDEEEIKERFLKAYNILTGDKEALLEDCRIIQEALTDTTEIDKKLVELSRESEIVSELMQKSIDENACMVQSQEDYNERYAAYEAKYDELDEKIRELKEKKKKQKMQYKAIAAFMLEIMEFDKPLNAFDDKLWIATIDTVTAYHDGRLVFKFKTGAEIEA